MQKICKSQITYNEVKQGCHLYQDYAVTNSTFIYILLNENL